MQLIEELVDYFSELLTEDQKERIEQIWHIDLPSTAGDQAKICFPEGTPAAEKDPDEEYEKLYDFPRRTGKQAHAGRKRRPPRRAPVSAESLVAIFQKMAKTCWKQVPVTLDLYLALAKADPRYAEKKSRASRWQRFLLAVECLESLDETVLSNRLAALLQKEKKQPEGSRKLFLELFGSMADRSFFRLTGDFSSQHITRGTAKAFLAALRNTVYPENPDKPVDTALFQSFLEIPDLAAVFSYYKIQRKLEYILKPAMAKARRRQRRRSRRRR